jgi:acid phosphatase class B
MPNSTRVPAARLYFKKFSSEIDKKKFLKSSSSLSGGQEDYSIVCKSFLKNENFYEQRKVKCEKIVTHFSFFEP